MDIFNRLRAYVFALPIVALSAPVALAEEPGEMISVPDGVSSVAVPNGDGGGVCGEKAIINAFRENAEARVFGTEFESKEYLLAAPMGKSQDDDALEAPLKIIEFSSGEFSINIDGVVNTLNYAFGNGAARIATEADYNNPDYLKAVNGNAIVVATELADFNPWSRIPPEKQYLCTGKISTPTKVYMPKL